MLTKYEARKVQDDLRREFDGGPARFTMHHSRHLRQQALRELMDSKYGRTRLRLPVLIAVAFIALLLAGPIVVESERKPPPISAQAEKARAERATVRAEYHRKAVFDERKRRWEEQKSSGDRKMAGGKDEP